MTIQQSFKTLLGNIGFSVGARNALVNADREALAPADLVNFTESNTVELFKSLFQRIPWGDWIVERVTRM